MEPIDVVIGAFMVSNFTSTHTSSNVRYSSQYLNLSLHSFSGKSMTQALYQLADNSIYAPMLREEVESAVKKHGWSKTAIDSMRKLDSFMRESQRVNGITHSQFNIALYTQCF